MLNCCFTDWTYAHFVHGFWREKLPFEVNCVRTTPTNLVSLAFKRNLARLLPKAIWTL